VADGGHAVAKVDAWLKRKVEPKAIALAEDACARTLPLAARRSHTILNGDSKRVVFAFARGDGHDQNCSDDDYFPPD
jgi:hypothetical protein